MTLRACHALPVWNNLGISSDDTEIIGRKHGDSYPWFGNALLLTAGAAMDL